MPIFCFTEKKQFNNEVYNNRRINLCDRPNKFEFLNNNYQNKNGLVFKKTESQNANDRNNFDYKLNQKNSLSDEKFKNNSDVNLKMDSREIEKDLNLQINMKEKEQIFLNLRKQINILQEEKETINAQNESNYRIILIYFTSLFYKKNIFLIFFFIL